jgi:hypothetical protein
VADLPTSFPIYGTPGYPVSSDFSKVGPAGWASAQRCSQFPLSFAVSNRIVDVLILRNKGMMKPKSHYF